MSINLDRVSDAQIIADRLVGLPKHGPEWDAAFDAILDEYNRIGDELFGKQKPL